MASCAHTHTHITHAYTHHTHTYTHTTHTHTHTCISHTTHTPTLPHSHLQELHKHRASTEHTTLLLNCYTKLKLEDKLQVRAPRGWRDGVQCVHPGGDVMACSACTPGVT